MAKPEQRERISKGAEFMAGMIAWMIFAFNFILELLLDWFGIGEILTIILMACAYVSFGLWFTWKGVSIMNRDFFIKWAISEIPIVNMFQFSFNQENGMLEPGIKKMVANTIKRAREEDKKYNDEQLAKSLPKNIVQFRQDNTRIANGAEEEFQQAA